MTRFLVVGYGNTIRGDDGLGPHIAQGLDIEKFPPSSRVKVLSLPQPDISLVSEFSDVDIVIFADARCDDDDALLRVERIETNAPGSCLAHSSHALGIHELLAIAAGWYGKQPTCFLIKPKGFDFSIGETLSEQAEKAALQASQAIYRLIERHVSGVVL